MTKEGLKEYLVDEAEYRKEVVESMSSYELLDAWLEWNGMLGWTSSIIDAVEGAYETLLED